MQKREAIYEGKAKILYNTDEAGKMIQYFKDDATAFNAQKRGTVASKGVMNNMISEVLFKYLESNGVPTHFLERLNDREMLVYRLEMFPIEVILRNIVAGSMAKQLGLEEGQKLRVPVLEFCYKSDPLNDPMINDYHIKALGWASDEELSEIERLTFRINDLMKTFFDKRDLILVDFKLEFGRRNGKVILADEICPDTCRFWQKGSLEKMDKDRFRRDLGGVEEAYQEVCRRVVQ
jgi:phosphoribosylaminoimidazole-succinocarboxamide synthase